MICVKMIVLLAMKIYDYMLVLPRMPSAKFQGIKPFIFPPESLFRNNMPTNKKKNRPRWKNLMRLLVITTFFIMFFQYKRRNCVFFTSFKQSLNTDFFPHWSCSNPYFDYLIKYYVTLVLLYFGTLLSNNFSILYDWYVGISFFFPRRENGNLKWW